MTEINEKLEIFAEHFGIDSSSDIISTFIEKKIIKNDEIVVNSREYEDTTTYYVISPCTPMNGDGVSASINPGPVSRMRDHGMLLRGVRLYSDVDDPISEDRHHPTADTYISAEFKYVGTDHPIIEMYESE